MVPSWQVGRLGAVLAGSESERGKIPRTDVGVEQPDFLWVALVQNRSGRDFELDQSAGHEEQLHESRRERGFGERDEGGRTKYSLVLSP